MLIITNKPEEWKAWKDAGHQIVDAKVPPCSAAKWDREGTGLSFKRLDGTGKGACLILGMGPSRKLYNPKWDLPTFGINRAALEMTPTYWVAHDEDSVMDCDAVVPDSVPLLTYSFHHLKPSFDKVKRRVVYYYDIYHDPTLHLKRPLYWNGTTLGIALDVAVRMGFDPIYTLGTDLTVGGYVNPHMGEEEMKLEHTTVKNKMCYMFLPDQVPKWNTTGAKIIDLSGGNMPCEKGQLSALSAYEKQ